MRRTIISVLVALILIILVIGGYFGLQLIERYTPTKEIADLQAVFEVADEEVALFYNQELTETKGIYKDGQTYLPYQWVIENLNERFYWDTYEHKLLYALPDQLLSATDETLGGNGKKLMWLEDDVVYLSLGLIKQYTDVRLESYDSGDVKRVFADNIWESQTVAAVSHDGKIREKGGIKSPIITTAYKDETVVILEEMEGWSKVRTIDGCIGYIENKKLGDKSDEALVSTFEAPVYTNITMDEKVCLVWHQVTNMDANKGLEDLISKTQGVNVVSPTWFSMQDNEGNFSSLASADYVRKAHELGLQVWALIDNFGEGVRSHELLARTSTRQKLIEGLMKAADDYDLDGINLDFESMKSEAGIHYSQFFRELSIACRAKGLVLSIDNYVPSASTRFYNRKEQGVVADYVIIMGYDEHYAGGEAGSVASLDYVRYGIEETLKEVPKEKVVNAIPFYTRVWTEKDGDLSSRALGISGAAKWVKDNQVELFWQESLGQYYGEVETDNGLQYLWMEDKRSVEEKMKLIGKYDLGGIACWKLGLESEEIWEVVKP